MIVLAGQKHLRLPSVKPSLARLPETGGCFSCSGGGKFNYPGPRPKAVCPIRSCGESAFQRWSCSLVSFEGKNRFALSYVRPSCWLSSHRSFGVGIWRRTRRQSSRYAPARTPEIALGGRPLGG